MPLLASFTEILSRLEDWRGFPKYALERRLDIFLTPYLASYVGERMESPVELVAPEFPLKRDGDARSTNVDYLLHRGGRRPAWVFLELKTDARSIKPEQLALYLAAKNRGLPAIVADIENFILPNTKQRTKYLRLLDRVTGKRDGRDALGDEIEVVYLSPKAPTTDERVAWLSLADFAAWTPPVHRELWTRLQPLIQTLQNDGD